MRPRIARCCTRPLRRRGLAQDATQPRKHAPEGDTLLIERVAQENTSAMPCVA
jgi:hypothetical protein